MSHETYPEPTELPLSHKQSAGELFLAARPYIGDGASSLALERDLVVAIDCPRCGWKSEVFRPRTRVRLTEATCPTCRTQGRPELVSAIDDDSPLAELPLAKLGIPAYDIVRIDGETGSAFFLLAGDRPGRDSGWGL